MRFFLPCVRTAALLCAAVLLVLTVTAPVSAQTAVSAQAPDSGNSGKAPASAESLDSKSLRDLADTLKNEKTRNKFIEQLETLAKAREAVERGESGEADSGTWLSSLSNRLRDMVGSFIAIGALLSELPKLFGDIAAGLQDPETRLHWLGVLGDIAAILVAGYAAFFVVAFLVRTPRRAIEARNQRSLWVRGALSLLRAVLDLIPLAAFGGAAVAAASLAEPETATWLAALSLVNAKLVTGAAFVVALLLLAPYADQLRVLPVGSETAQYLYIWCRRVVGLSVYGYFLLEACRHLGLTPAIHDFLFDLLGLAVAILLIILIMQNRETAARSIAAPSREAGPFAAIRRPLAATWHWLAIVYVVALYFVLAVHGNGGTQYILQGTVVTAVVVGVAWAFESAVRRAIRRGLTIGDDLRRRFPGLQGRLNRYTVALDYAVRVIVFCVAAVAVLEAWGIQAFAWIVSSAGERVLAAAANIVVITVLAVVVWELASSLIERRLNAADDGQRPSTRARTLLPLAQTALKIVLVVLVAMVVLSEVGVNITPLLAGAGVVGLAVGFGAQKLVQDVITGWFILMEDTISVGDVADVAGHAGLVERINIRTIRLRDLSGVVHTIPFSSVDAVKNFTKDFSYYLFDVGVAYREDTDEVVDVLRGIDEEMRADDAFKDDILEPLEVMGVDRFDDSAVIVRVRTKTRPLRQWSVGREFNRRMKKAFDARGIEIPFPHQTVYFGVDKDGAAPAANLRIEQELSEAFADRQAGPDRAPSSNPKETTQGREATISDEDVPDGDAPR